MQAAFSTQFPTFLHFSNFEFVGGRSRQGPCENFSTLFGGGWPSPICFCVGEVKALRSTPHLNTPSSSFLLPLLPFYFKTMSNSWLFSATVHNCLEKPRDLKSFRSLQVHWRHANRVVNCLVRIRHSSFISPTAWSPRMVVNCHFELSNPIFSKFSVQSSIAATFKVVNCLISELRVCHRLFQVCDGRVCGRTISYGSIRCWWGQGGPPAPFPCAVKIGESPSLFAVDSDSGRLSCSGDGSSTFVLNPAFSLAVLAGRAQ